MLSKKRKELAERIAELELQIDFAKKFDLDYIDIEIELNELYEELDGGSQ